MTQRVIEFNTENKALFTILNIIAHDPIHDYGATSNISRWNKNANIVKNFGSDKYTFAHSGGMKIENRMKLWENRGKKRGYNSNTRAKQVLKNQQEQRKENINAERNNLNYNEPDVGPIKLEPIVPGTETIRTDNTIKTFDTSSGSNLFGDLISESASSSQTSIEENLNDFSNNEVFNNAINEMVDDVNTSIIFLLFQVVIEWLRGQKKQINIDEQSIITQMIELIKPTESGAMELKEGPIFVDEHQNGGGMGDDYAKVLTKIITKISEPKESKKPQQTSEQLFNKFSNWLSLNTILIKDTIMKSINPKQKDTGSRSAAADATVTDTSSDNGSGAMEGVTKKDTAAEKNVIHKKANAAAETSSNANSGKNEEFTAKVQSATLTDDYEYFKKENEQSASQTDDDDDEYFKEENEQIEIKEKIKKIKKIEENIKIKEATKNEIEIPYKEAENDLEKVVSTDDFNNWVDLTNKKLKLKSPNTFNPARSDRTINETISKNKQKLNNLRIEQSKKIRQDIKEFKQKQNNLQKEIDNLESGQLSKEEIKIRGNFCNFIAKSGLYLTGVCDKDGFKQNGFKQNDLQGNIYDKLLNRQIDILLYQSGWNNGESKITTGQLDYELFKFYSTTKSSSIAVKASSPDNHLFTKMQEKRYFPYKEGLKYIVNNAAPINNKYTFCPYSSILDGMSNCSSTTTTFERGNMNFKIKGPKPNSIYYNGKLNLNPFELSESIENSSVNLDFDVRLNLDSKTINLTGKKENIILKKAYNLEAHNVLKNTLVKIIQFIEKPFNFLTPPKITIPTNIDGTSGVSTFNVREIQDYILDTDNYVLADDRPQKPKSNIFNNLFNIFVLNPDLFKIVYSEILFKVVGDLFQEINSVCKYGGYNSMYYKATDDVIKYDMMGNGNTIRGFFANDRPSGIRFLYMLQHANQNCINQEAYGGYYSNSKGNTTELIGSAPPSAPIYAAKAGSKGGFPIKKTQKTKRKKKNKQKTKQTRKHKKTQKSKQTRKHKKKIIRHNTRKI